MAVQAVIDEQLCAMLERRRLGAHRSLVQMHAGAGGHRHGRREQRHGREPLDEVDHSRFHLKFTLSGSGLHGSSLLYHGISRKKAKYSTEQICDTSVRPGVGASTPR